MKAAPAEPRICSIARTLDIVGEKWALLAVREVFLGDRRFDEMVKRTGAPRDTLAARLRTLVNAGVLERRPYSEHPARFEYFLTEAGLDLYPVITTLRTWGDKYLAGSGGPPLRVEHKCGHELAPRLVCEACGEPVSPRDTRAVYPDPAGTPLGRLFLLFPLRRAGVGVRVAEHLVLGDLRVHALRPLLGAVLGLEV